MKKNARIINNNNDFYPENETRKVFCATIATDMNEIRRGKFNYNYIHEEKGRKENKQIKVTMSRRKKAVFLFLSLQINKEVIEEEFKCMDLNMSSTYV